MDSSSIESAPLRPELYARLLAKFKVVKTSKNGLSIAWSLRTNDENGRVERWFDKSKNDDWGEYYRCCCPFCHDRKFRLSICHMWGAWDEATRCNNTWLIKCHRRNCLADWQQQWALYQTVFSEVSGGALRGPDVVQPGNTQAPVTGGAIWPGTSWPINQMAADYPAVRYLRDERGFDPNWLWDSFRVGVLIDAKPKCGHLRDRLIIPVFYRGEPAGWQARLARKALPGEKKYLSMPNMPRRSLLYNFDSAVRFPFVVVVEGPTDVWRFGPEAVAVMGTFSGQQAKLLMSHWKTVVVLLDEDAASVSRELFQILSQSVRVVEVRLPKDMDPGDFATTAELRGYVARELAKQNFSLAA